MSSDINFRKSQFTYHDGWRQTDRTAHFMGKCVVCGRRTYQFEDGENDPRGVLGDHAGDPLVASDYGYSGKDVPMCFYCGNNTEASYLRGLVTALKKWRAPKEDIAAKQAELSKAIRGGW